MCSLVFIKQQSAQQEYKNLTRPETALLKPGITTEALETLREMIAPQGEIKRLPGRQAGMQEGPALKAVLSRQTDHQLKWVHTPHTCKLMPCIPSSPVHMHHEALGVGGFWRSPTKFYNGCKGIRFISQRTQRFKCRKVIQQQNANPQLGGRGSIVAAP